MPLPTNFSHGHNQAQGYPQLNRGVNRPVNKITITKKNLVARDEAFFALTMSGILCKKKTEAMM